MDSARSVAEQWNAVVVLKGATTVVAAPDGACGNTTSPTWDSPISGSGDTLAGIIAGLAARGAPAEQAAAWGVVLHALAGESLVKTLRQAWIPRAGASRRDSRADVEVGISGSRAIRMPLTPK